jgi:hypothetical protein
VVWEVEWSSCNVSFVELARDPDIRLPMRTLRSWLAISPQYAADRMARRIETGPAGGGWTGRVLVAAIDGCRNGILWEYYH